MKQIGTAFVMYVNDHNGAMPYVVNESYWKQWAPAFFGNPNSTGEPQLNNVHRHLMKYLGGKVRQNEAQMTLVGSMIYRCPTAVDFPTAQNGPGVFSNTNYTFNGVFMRRKSGNIKRSSEFVISSEGRYAWNASAMRPFPVANTNFPTVSLDTLEYRQWMWVESGGTAGYSPLLNLTLHRGGKAGNVIYLDGHAGTVDYRDIRPKDFGLTDSATPGSGLETDTFARLIGPGGATLNYRAKLR